MEMSKARLIASIKMKPLWSLFKLLHMIDSKIPELVPSSFLMSYATSLLAPEIKLRPGFLSGTIYSDAISGKLRSLPRRKGHLQANCSIFHWKRWGQFQPSQFPRIVRLFPSHWQILNCSPFCCDHLSFFFLIQEISMFASWLSLQYDIKRKVIYSCSGELCCFYTLK